MRLFEISAGFYIASALAVLVLPWNILGAFLLAAGFHELCHLAALKCCAVWVQQIKLGAFGAKITTGILMPEQELICAAAGPMGSLLLVLLVKRMPLTAIFGLVQGIFNLLPIYPLDGGRVVRTIFVLAKKA